MARVMSGSRPPIAAAHLRKDAWWALPVTVVIVLGSFIVYSTWAAFQNAYYWAPPYLSPFYSPCLSAKCLHVTFGYGLPDISVPIVGILSPAFLILWGPGLFRLTCYYYRKAYYRSFWLAPTACAVRDVEVRLHRRDPLPPDLPEHAPLRLVCGGGLHRAPHVGCASCLPLPHADGTHRFGIGVGTLVMWINVILLAGYTFSCHSCRHLCGGHVDVFSRAKTRYRFWHFLTRLNEKHPAFAWLSLFSVGLTDLYIRLVAMGDDPRPEDYFLMAKPAYETHEHDVIVIGAGGAGLRAAIEAARTGRVGRSHLQVAPRQGPHGHGRGRHRGGHGQRVAGGQLAGPLPRHHARRQDAEQLAHGPAARPGGARAGARAGGAGARCSIAPRTGCILQRDFGGPPLRAPGPRGRPHRARDDPHAAVPRHPPGHRRLHGVQHPAPAQGRRSRRRRRRLLAGERASSWSSRPRPSCSPPAASARPGRSRRTPGSTPATATPWRCGPAPT